MHVRAREAALLALEAWDEKGTHLQESLERLLGPDTPDKERRLARELAAGVLRHKLYLDHAVSQSLKGPIRRLTGAVFNILRLGLYQLAFLDRVPAHSAVDESVKIAKKYGRGASFRLVNAVLRDFLRRNKTVNIPHEDPEKELSISSSHPPEIIRRWIHLWGLDKTRAICEANNSRPAACLRVNLLKAGRVELIERLKGEGIEARASQTHPLAVHVPRTFSPASSEAFREGWFQVQEETMLEIVDRLDAAAGQRILDLCSAPGTKATAIAERIGDRGFILALDDAVARLKLLIESMMRLGTRCIRPVAGDARQCRNLLRIKFDRILCDVPCSNTGVFSRRVEARWRWSLANLKRLAAFQAQILEAALDVLKDGGILVYSTCSIDPLENEEVVRVALSHKTGYEVLEERTFFPSEGRGGGYFAKIRRRKSETN